VSERRFDEDKKCKLMLYEELVEYSDDDDETAATKTGNVDEGIRKPISAEETKEDAEKAIVEKESDERVEPKIEEGNGRVVNVSRVPEEESLFRLFGPPPKVLHSRRSEQAEGSNSHTSKNHTDGEDGIDLEWGLGVEKSSDNIDEELFKKLAHFHKLKKEQGTHFNQSLNRNRSFHNPHIYSKLVQWVEVEETGSGYSDMIKGGKVKADSIWPSSSEARQQLLKQGGKNIICECPYKAQCTFLHAKMSTTATLQRKRQEESDERKKKVRRDNLDFVGASSKSSSPAPNHSLSRSQSEALALAESRARKIRDDLVGKRDSTNDERDRYRRREGERDSSRSHHSRRP
jgi:hypothetical protein